MILWPHGAPLDAFVARAAATTAGRAAAAAAGADPAAAADRAGAATGRLMRCPVRAFVRVFERVHSRALARVPAYVHPCACVRVCVGGGVCMPGTCGHTLWPHIPGPRSLTRASALARASKQEQARSLTRASALARCTRDRLTPRGLPRSNNLVQFVTAFPWCRGAFPAVTVWCAFVREQHKHKHALCLCACVRVQGVARVCT